MMEYYKGKIFLKLPCLEFCFCPTSLNLSNQFDGNSGKYPELFLQFLDDQGFLTQKENILHHLPLSVVTKRSRHKLTPILRQTALFIQKIKHCEPN